MRISVQSTLVSVCCGLLLASCTGSAQVKLNAGAKTDGAETTETTETTETEPPAPAAEGRSFVEDPEDVHIEGDHLKVDQKIHFGHDSDEILSDSAELLDHIATTLNNHGELTAVHIIGHTDASGGHDHNLELSERRAAAVAKVLAERGVRQKLDSKGVGETEPVCSEDTDTCHESNRRVEFVIEK